MLFTMLDGESGKEVPLYSLGPKIRSLVIAILWFAASLFGAYFVGKLFVAVHGVNNSGNIYIAFNYAGLLSVLGLVLSFSAVIATFSGLVIGLFVLRTGRLDLHEDYAIWKRRGKSEKVDYSEFTDAYFGYQAIPVHMLPSPGYGSENELYRKTRIVSFYIGKKLFNFVPRRKPGLTKFLESKIPKANIDVDDDKDQGSTAD